MKIIKSFFRAGYVVGFLAVIAAVVPGCSSIPDFLVCTNLGSQGYCRTYVSKRQVTIDDDKNLYTYNGKKYKWTDISRMSVVIPPDQFVMLKNFSDNYCHQNFCPDGVGDWNGFFNDLNSHLVVPSK